MHERSQGAVNTLQFATLLGSLNQRVLGSSPSASTTFLKRSRLYRPALVTTESMACASFSRLNGFDRTATFSRLPARASLSA